MQQIIKPPEEKEKLEGMLLRQKKFIYLQCLQRDEIKQIKELLDERVQELDNLEIFCGISAASVNREAYYWEASRIKGCRFTFKGLWEGKRIKMAVPSVFFSAENKRELYKKIEELKNVLQKPNTVCFLDIKEDFFSALSNMIMLYPNCIWIDNRKMEDLEEAKQGKNRWSLGLSEKELSITVICTLYKRPDNLKRQLNAIQDQTIQPREILLFQDGIQEDYQIKLSESMKRQFSQVKVCSANEGVWGRFRYAKTAVSEYVCVFDDDTIPGKRWLENCHYNMMKKEGVYGTVGILFSRYDVYPYAGYNRIGWVNPEEEVRRVDFVGHAWFIRKNWLEWMFEGTEKYQALKYAGEDMCLSVKCKEHGVNTFVPEHPVNNKEFWGSLPEFGERLGISESALSLNKKNHMRMQNAVKSLVAEGWKLCYMEDEAYVKKIVHKQTLLRIKKIIQRIKRHIVFFNKKL